MAELASVSGLHVLLAGGGTGGAILPPPAGRGGAPGLPGLLAGGGPGGHISPAMAVAAALVRRGGRATFVGSERGLEAKLVPEIAASIPGGVPFHALPAKPLLGRGIVDKLRALWTLVGSSFQGRAL